MSSYFADFTGSASRIIASDGRRFIEALRQLSAADILQSVVFYLDITAAAALLLGKPTQLEDHHFYPFVHFYLIDLYSSDASRVRGFYLCRLILT